MRKFVKRTGEVLSNGAIATGKVLGKGAVTVGHIANGSLLKLPGVVMNSGANVIGAELDRLGDKFDGKMVKPRKTYRKLRIREDEHLNKVLTGDITPKEYVSNMTPDFIKSSIAMSKEAVDKHMQNAWKPGENIVNEQ